MKRKMSKAAREKQLRLGALAQKKYIMRGGRGKKSSKSLFFFSLKKFYIQSLEK